MNFILEMEPIVGTNWGMSLARLLDKPVWDTLRREVYANARYVCQICGATDTVMNCHEVWKYKDKKKVQFLADMECICTKCHDIKHWGRTVAVVHQGQLSTKYLQELTDHFCKINQCTPMDFELHKSLVGNQMEKRNKFRYKIDWGKFTPERVTKAWIERQKNK